MHIEWNYKYTLYTVHKSTFKQKDVLYPKRIAAYGGGRGKNAGRNDYNKYS